MVLEVPEFPQKLVPTMTIELQLEGNHASSQMQVKPAVHSQAGSKVAPVNEIFKQVTALAAGTWKVN